MRVIAFLSQKGGCGKTTSCLNIAALLAGEHHQRTLIIDLDSNACASRTFDVTVELAQSVGAALLGERSLASLVRPTGLEQLWLAPGSPELRLIENYTPADPALGNADGRLSEQALAVALPGLADLFDYVLVDCPGGHSFMEHAVLLACDEVVVPTGLSVYDLYATTPTMDLISAARRKRGGDQPALLGLLPNGAGKAGVPARVQSLLDEIPGLCLSPIRHSATLRTVAIAPRVDQRLLVAARPDHPASASYRQVAREIVLGLEAARPLPAEAVDGR